ncbi:NADH-quinone oxidoreductase subunit L, partial [Kaistella sp.]|uniref:NADH-quinone oxidoreductase subunit L n=1 Tax=Kaistella sp. TaxID=2782235 RepID=UPI0035A07B3F
MENLVYAIILLPLAGFLFNGLFGKKLPKVLVGTVATAVVFASFLIASSLFLKFDSESQPVIVKAFEWFRINGIQVNFAFQIDQLSLMMVLIITGIGSLIHLYSIGYMATDEGFYKFFSYMNLFIFMMLLLVMGSNYLILFIGWEGVGLCSYLLIGFWYKNKEYGAAARKAFIMNRIGDLGMIIGILMIAFQTNAIDYLSVAQNSGKFELDSGVIIFITASLFIGAIGKSAQVPLFTWLPDAMAGPTPVSALIHAATMVTAGIYLVVRSNFLFSLAPTTMDAILFIGLLTALVAAFIGLRQNDIKKVLAYSTVSQLGFMFVAVGVGAYTVAMFHLMTHAFFKALLFLGSGSVIHAMSGEQDMRLMGGLKKKIPITHITFLIGTLAISGFPFLSGMISKDEILANAFGKNPMIWVILFAIAAMTAIYMFRAYYLT